MIKVLFFAQVRELIGAGEIDISPAYPDIAALRRALAERGDRWALALDSDKLLAAVNQTLVPMTHPLRAGDEVAFFPPVTGG
ncbi:molybdopterin synthase sulfur carrier subunit [Mixta mediterraneensis]|uniref:molybdopterin synthase sulfur carrier subunit n=1 Tax=Mixta mediterraneensis TaxID=2758443 RepID=UPI001875572D|nr:molybdopterin synthase sulfur carrier subunit [Mixta mediterraneensis]MBE5250899.1 molybdopterin synthase sulfur carrier subunit [Mixta mediterraneensis]